MKMPWTNRTGMAKAAAIAATVLLVSFGLCGTQWGAYLAVSYLPVAYSDGWTRFMIPVVIVTGYLELGAMAVSLVVLVLIGIVAIFGWLRRRLGAA